MTGGGSGHEPAFIGYTGRNMLDAVCSRRTLFLTDGQELFTTRCAKRTAARASSAFTAIMPATT